MSQYYNPFDFLEVKVTKQIVFFYSLSHFYFFRSLVNGGKVKSFGLSKRYTFTFENNSFTAIGGVMGAAMSCFTLELAVANGAEQVFVFGTAASCNSDLEIGDCFCPQTALDCTSMSAEYGQDKELQLTPVDAMWQVKGKIASINHPLLMTQDKLDSLLEQQVTFIDMEIAPLIACSKQKRSSVSPFFMCSDIISIGEKWQNGRTLSCFMTKEEEALTLYMNSIKNIFCNKK